jgi:hypothetical protein
MSKIVETALSGLREIGLEKLAKLDSICDNHLAWLTAAVGDVKRQIAETGHAAKKRRVGLDKVEDIAEDDAKVCRKTSTRVFCLLDPHLMRQAVDIIFPFAGRRSKRKTRSTR